MPLRLWVALRRNKEEVMTEVLRRDVRKVTSWICYESCLCARLSPHVRLYHVVARLHGLLRRMNYDNVA